MLKVETEKTGIKLNFHKYRGNNAPKNLTGKSLYLQIMGKVNFSKRLKKKIGIVGFPIDLGADRRGVDMGPSALRYAHLEQKLENMGYVVKDFGDIVIEGAETQWIRNPKLKG